MILFTNSLGEIKAVGMTDNQTLTRLDIIEDELFPFAGWSEVKIKCYKIGVIPVLVDVVVGTEEVEVEDLDGNKTIETRDVIEQRETGQSRIVMMTPYVLSSMIEPIEEIYEHIGVNAENIESSSEAIDYMLETALPEQDERQTGIEEALDYLFTEILPKVQG